jgi:hypothetical protein
VPPHHRPRKSPGAQPLTSPRDQYIALEMAIWSRGDQALAGLVHHSDRAVNTWPSVTPSVTTVWVGYAGSRDWPTSESVVVACPLVSDGQRDGSLADAREGFHKLRIPGFQREDWQ